MADTTFVDRQTQVVAAWLNDVNNWTYKDITNVKNSAFGATGNGTTDDTAGVQAAIDYRAANGGGWVYFPYGTYLCGLLTIYSNIILLGAGTESSIIKLKSGTNNDLIYGAGSNALWDTNSIDGIQNWGLCNIMLEGNRAENSSGSCIAVYGQRALLRDVYIKNAPEHGIRTRWGQWGGEAPFALEGRFDRVKIDTTGKHGWLAEGPHDSVITGVEIIDAGQSADNTYDNFHASGYWNARVFGLHCWNRGGLTNRARYALYDDIGSSEYLGCHFEGAKTASELAGGPRNIHLACRWYATYGGKNIIVAAAEQKFQGYLGPEASGAAVLGVQLGRDVLDNATACNFDLDIADQTGGFIDWTNSLGNNVFVIRGVQAEVGGGFIGSPYASDAAEIRVGGPTGMVTRIRPSYQGLTAAGTVQGDATLLPRGFDSVDVTVVGAGQGVRLWAANKGESQLIHNGGANTLNVYPASGANIGKGLTDAPITVGVDKSVLLASTGDTHWIALQGA